MLTQLANPQRQSFFERLSPLPRANVVRVEASGIGLGDRLIHRPAQIHLRQDATWLQSIEIVDGEGNRDIVLFKDPLRLPAHPTAGT